MDYKSEPILWSCVVMKYDSGNDDSGKLPMVNKSRGMKDEEWEPHHSVE